MGITEVEGVKWKVEIYPNPASGEVHVKGLPAGSRIELYDASGRLLLSTVDCQLSSVNFPSGLYLLRCIAPDGATHTEKLIIRK